MKKRIDLTQLQRAKPSLYEEFRDHYAQMSEKSFDHTKKYWFNRLRKDFLLEVIDTPKSSAGSKVAANVAEQVSPNIAAADPTGSASTSSPGFKPRFKSNAVKPVVDGAVAPKQGNGDEATQPNAKPTKFKPRFKAGEPTSVNQATDLRVSGKESEQEPDKRPVKATSEEKPLGLKPRFKAGTTTPEKASGRGSEPNAESTEPAAGPPEENITPKPLGFTPRFKAGK